jgi:AcrR family transcriptional regulator
MAEVGGAAGLSTPRSSPPSSSPSRRRGELTRDRLLAAAARLFAEQGFDATSVESVATAAGITVSGMYKHFPTKAHLLLEVARRATRTSAARRALGKGPDLPGQLAALFVEYTAPGQIERRRLSIELSRAAYQNDELRAAVAAYNAELRDSLRGTIVAARPGLVAHGAEADLLAHLVLVLLMGAIHIDTLDPELIGDAQLAGLLRDRLAALLDGPVPGPGGRGVAGGPAVPAVPSVDGCPEAEPEPPDGRRRRAARTRRRVVAAAAELFALHGYDGTSTEMIAAKADITVPGLYLHVASKEDLLVEVGRRTFATYRLAGPLDRDGDASAHLAELAVAFSGPGDRVQRRLAIELDFGAWRSPRLATALRDYHRSVRGNVAAAVAARSPRADLAAMPVLMLFMGIAHLDTVDPSLVGDPGWADLLRQRLPQLIG